MKNISKIAIMLFCGSLLFCANSCIRDQDFDQADEIEIAPELEVNLIYLQLRPVNFVNSAGDPEISEVNQTTDLNFLQDAFIQNDLQKIDFTFSSENSFSQSFNTSIRFYDEFGEEVYNMSFVVPGSETGSVNPSTYIEVVEGESLLNFKRAVRMEIAATMVYGGQPINGALDFKSKASLYFEFD